MREDGAVLTVEARMMCLGVGVGVFLRGVKVSEGGVILGGP